MRQLFLSLKFCLIIISGVIFCLVPQANSWAADHESHVKSLASYMLGVVYDLEGMHEQAIARYEESLQYEDSNEGHLHGCYSRCETSCNSRHEDPYKH